MPSVSAFANRYVFDSVVLFHGFKYTHAIHIRNTIVYFLTIL